MRTKLICLLLATFRLSELHAQWQPVDEMGYGRTGHAAVSFLNSEGFIKLVVAGGYDGNSGLSSAEVFDEGNETWDNLPDMATVRMDHTMDVIGNQKIIIIGGWDGASTNWASTEVLEENGGSYEFSDGPDMSVPRSYHGTALYESDYLLVMGGYDGFDNLASCEKLNTATMEFEPMASMNYGRSSFTVTPLASGYEFLVTGGFNPDFGFQMNQCEIYNAQTNTWTPAASLNYARDNHAAILLPDNRVLVTGGRFFNGDLNLFEGMDQCEIYDPVTNTWSVVQSTSGKHSYHQLFLLDGKVLLPGGTDHSGINVDVTYSNTEFFDPATETWSDGGITVPGRYRYAGGATAAGIVICGGLDDNASGGEIYYFGTGIPETPLQEVLAFPTLIAPGGTVYLTAAARKYDSIAMFDGSGREIVGPGKGTQEFTADFAPGVYTLVLHKTSTSEAEHIRIVIH